MIIGVDENNYSPSLAGDCLVTAYAAFKKIDGVKSSKELTHKKQLELYPQLIDPENGRLHVELASVHDIQIMGIYRARNHAIDVAARALMTKLRMEGYLPPEQIILDGYFSKKLLNAFELAIGFKLKAIINADATVYECSAASIVGRIYADALFAGWGSWYPGYRLERNHGSPDIVMYEKIRKDGPTPIHRVKNYGPDWWRKIYGQQSATGGRNKNLEV